MSLSFFFVTNKLLDIYYKTLPTTYRHVGTSLQNISQNTDKTAAVIQ